MIKYEERIQKLPGACRLVDKDGNKVPLHFLKWVFWYFIGGIKEHIFVSTAERATEMVAEAEKKGMGAFASGPIPCNNNQHGVFAVSCSGETEWIFKSRYYFDIKKAHDSVFGVNNPIQTVSGKEIPIKTDKKDTCLACKVRFPIFDKEDKTKVIAWSDKLYTYKCRQYHFEGEKVAVKVIRHRNDNPEFKNVKIVETFITTEHELQLLAESVGRKEIYELYCEQAIEL